MTLGHDATLTAATATFHGTLAGGGKNLSIVGTAVLGNDPTDTVNNLATLTVSGTTTINTATVTTSGTQTYSDAVSIGADTALTASTASFTGTVSSSTTKSLSITARRSSETTTPTP